jgi:hypothetical protein
MMLHNNELYFSLAARYPQKMKVEVIGRSWQGRDIRVVTVGNRSALHGITHSDTCMVRNGVKIK